MVTVADKITEDLKLVYKDTYILQLSIILIN